MAKKSAIPSPELFAKMGIADPSGKIAPIAPAETATIGEDECAPEELAGPEIIVEGDPDGRQPGMGDDPIDLPEHIKNAGVTSGMFGIATSDAPMTIEDLEKQVTERGQTVDDTQAPVHTSEQIPNPPLAAITAPAISSRVREEQEAGRAALARKRVERELATQRANEAQAKALRAGRKPDGSELS